MIESAGRAFPVETRYLGRDPARAHRGAGRADATLDSAWPRSAARSWSSCPARARSCASPRLLAERVRDPDVEIAPLYGALDARAQDRAVAPAPPGRRKIVLATSIAETSLTIEGVRVVIDSGLMRAPRFEPDLGLTRLETMRVSPRQRRPAARPRRPRRARRLLSAVGGGRQRRPRAVRGAGNPRRRSSPASRSIWRSGASPTPRRLRFLDPPPRAAMAEARALLQRLGALDADGRVTDEGRAIARLALPPRLARMLIDAAREGDGAEAAEIATLFSEPGLGGNAVDLERAPRRLPPRPLRPRRGCAAAGEDLARRAARGWRRPPRSPRPGRGSG